MHPRELDVLELFLVGGVIDGPQEFPDVIDRTPDFRNAPVDVQQSIGRFHPCADRIFRGEDGIPGSLRKLADEGEVDASFRNDQWAVAGFPRHEEGGDVRHVAGRGVGVLCGIFLDLLFRDADVVEPLLADFLPRALLHRLLDIVSWPVGEKAINPDADLALGLGMELGLTVDGPGQIPVVLGILDRHDASGGHLARERISLADGLDVRDDLVIQGGDGGAHPVGLLDIVAEDAWTAEGGILPGDVLPKVPAVPSSVLNLGKVRLLVLASIAGNIGAAAVGDEDQVIFL